MMQRAPHRSQQSYRHEAFLWHGRDDFTTILAAFVEEGVDLGEPVLVAMVEEHNCWLQDSLGPRLSRQIQFIDMADLGGNPTRIIPAWLTFAATAADPNQPIRGIGEPIWPGRHAEEMLECQLHEALLNVAIDPATPLWLLCPYDTEMLPTEVIEEAHRSHPVIVEAGSHRGSPTYAGRAHVDALFQADLPTPSEPAHGSVYTSETVHRLPSYANLELYVAGLPVDRAQHVAEATDSLARGSLRRGSPEVSIRIWGTADAVICEVVDSSPIDDPLHGRTIPADEHESLWHLHQSCDLVQLRSTSKTTTIRIISWRRPSTTRP